MIEEGLWVAKNKKSPVIHQQRPRRARAGGLVQIDGSPHLFKRYIESNLTPNQIFNSSIFNSGNLKKDFTQVCEKIWDKCPQFKEF